MAGAASPSLTYLRAFATFVVETGESCSRQKIDFAADRRFVQLPIAQVTALNPDSRPSPRTKAWLRIRADLHRESIRIDHMETETASLLVDRSDFSCLEISGHRLLVEVVDSDGKMIDFGRRLSFAQNQEVLPKHELVVSFSFVYFAIEYALIEIGRSLQIANLQRNVIDTAALKSRCVSRRSAGRQHGQSLYQRST
jgi:hypothetical protein